MRTFQVKNFEKFQHYKDRAPPWIKLYNELLDDYDFGKLPDASKMHLIAIWLLASRSENKIPYDSGWVSRRINATDKVDLDLLAHSGFIVVDQALQNVEQDASKTLATCLPREEESREEKICRKTPKRITYSTRFDADFWGNYPTDPLMSKKETYAEWQKLSPEDQDSAIKALPGFRASIAKQGKDYRVIHAVNFLKQRRFDGFADKVNGHTVTVQQVPVVEGSPGWLAWNARRKYPVTDLHIGPGQIKRGWYFPTEYPPQQESAA